MYSDGTGFELILRLKGLYSLKAGVRRDNKLSTIDKTGIWWENPTMKVQTIDAKRRLVLTGARSGECYAVRETAAGRYELAIVIPAPARKKPTEAQLDALLSASALTPKMDWETLRRETREL